MIIIHLSPARLHWVFALFLLTQYRIAYEISLWEKCHLLRSAILFVLFSLSLSLMFYSNILLFISSSNSANYHRMNLIGLHSLHKKQSMLYTWMMHVCIFDDWIDKWIKCKLIEHVRHGFNYIKTTKIISYDYYSFFTSNVPNFGRKKSSLRTHIVIFYRVYDRKNGWIIAFCMFIVYVYSSKRPFHALQNEIRKLAACSLLEHVISFFTLPPSAFLISCVYIFNENLN